MADVVLQSTFGARSDNIVYDDDTVYTDGVLNADAVVTHYDENGVDVIRLSLDKNKPTIIQANDVPVFIELHVKRELGWQDNLGYRATIINMTPEEDPGVAALAVYDIPECKNYLYTTGAFVHNEETGLWEAVCPAGHEPGQNDLHMGILMGSLPYSCFTLWADRDEQIFTAGGDL